MSNKAPGNQKQYLNAILFDGNFNSYGWHTFKGDGKISEYGSQMVFTGVEFELPGLEALPKDFDWRKLAIEGLRVSIKETQDEAARRIMRIEDFIGNMLALEAPKAYTEDQLIREYEASGEFKLEHGVEDDDFPF